MIIVVLKNQDVTMKKNELNYTKMFDFINPVDIILYTHRSVNNK